MSIDAVLFDIDTQHDFCDPAGSMYVPGAAEPAFRRGLGRLVDWARANGYPHVAAADVHPADEPNFSARPDMLHTYPPHCVVGTRGIVRVPETRQVAPAVFPLGAGNLVPGPGAGEFLLHKREADVFSNPATSRLLDHLNPRVVVVAGVATDYCVAAAVDGLLREHPGIEVMLAVDASAGVFSERVEACHERWYARGVWLLDSSEVPSVVEGAASAEG